MYTVNLDWESTEKLIKAVMLDNIAFLETNEEEKDTVVALKRVHNYFAPKHEHLKEQ